MASDIVNYIHNLNLIQVNLSIVYLLDLYSDL